MPEYINREETLKAFKLIAKNPNKDYQRGMQDTIDCLVPEVIADIPAADVQPVRHGRWIEVTPKHSRCSVCDTTCLIAVYPISKGANYCPNCGARMSED